jgi:hypothetical protein
MPTTKPTQPVPASSDADGVFDKDAALTMAASKFMKLEKMGEVDIFVEGARYQHQQGTCQPKSADVADGVGFDVKAAVKEFEKYEKGLFCIDSFLRGARYQFNKDTRQLRSLEAEIERLNNYVIGGYKQMYDELTEDNNRVSRQLAKCKEQRDYYVKVDASYLEDTDAAIAEMNNELESIK